MMRLTLYCDDHSGYVHIYIYIYIYIYAFACTCIETLTAAP